MPLCHSIKQEYEALQALTQEFVSLCAKGKIDGNFQRLSPQELQTVQRFKQRVEKARDALKDKLFVSPEAAEAIMNKDMGKDETKRQFFGIKEIKTAFNIDLTNKDLPPIPFTTRELKEAKERGDYLIYRPSHIPDGTPDNTPVTIEKIAERVQKTLTANNRGKALFKVDWYKNEPFYTKDTPHTGWALVSKEPLSDSTDKDYLQQTDRIVKELRILYPETDTRPIATTYHKAIEEFNGKRAKIQQLINDGQWKDAADILESLLITKQTRHTVPEVFYDATLLRAVTKSDILLANTYTWTSSRSSAGAFVIVGGADAGGASVNRWFPGNRLDNLGVLFVRSPR